MKKQQWLLFLILLTIPTLLPSCKRSVRVEYNSPFEVELLPYKKELGYKEEVIIRGIVSSESNYSQTSYSVRQFPEKGYGRLFFVRNGAEMLPNQKYPILKGDFKLRYIPEKGNQQEISLTFEDNWGHRHVKTLSFSHEED